MRRQAYTRFCNGGGEKQPRDEGNVDERRVRHPSRGNFDHLAEDERKYQRCKQGLEQGPAKSEGGLLVAHKDVAPDQDVEQFAEPPEILEVLAICVSGFDYGYTQVIRGDLCRVHVRPIPCATVVRKTAVARRPSGRRLESILRQASSCRG